MWWVYVSSVVAVGRLVLVAVRVWWRRLVVWVGAATVDGWFGIRVSWRRVGRGGGCWVGCAEDGLVWVWVRGFSWVQKECRVVWWLVGRVDWLGLPGLRLGWAFGSGW